MRILVKLFDTEMPLFALIVASLFVSILSGTYGYAEQKLPCAEEIAKYCKDLKPCEGRIISCLKENESKLSDECKGKINESKRYVLIRMVRHIYDIERVC